MDSVEPYLQYYLVANSETNPLSFPSFPFNVSASLESQCNEALFKWKIPDNPNSVVDFEKELYKGYCEDDDPTKIFVIVNITKYHNILTNTPPDSISRWGTVHELLNTRQIQLQPIDPTISALFWKKPEIWRISDKDKYEIEYPYLLYLCHSFNGRKSVYYTSTDMVPFTFPTTYLSSFGNVFLFSCIPIPDTGIQNALLMRFVVFLKEKTGETLHIINKNTDISQLKLGNNDNPDKMYNAIYFQEYGTPYFCVYSNTIFEPVFE
jgi:hypothetical protein